MNCFKIFQKIARHKFLKCWAKTFQWVVYHIMRVDKFTSHVTSPRLVTPRLGTSLILTLVHVHTCTFRPWSLTCRSDDKTVACAATIVYTVEFQQQPTTFIFFQFTVYKTGTGIYSLQLFIHTSYSRKCLSIIWCIWIKLLFSPGI